MVLEETYKTLLLEQVKSLYQAQLRLFALLSSHSREGSFADLTRQENLVCISADYDPLSMPPEDVKQALNHCFSAAKVVESYQGRSIVALGSLLTLTSKYGVVGFELPYRNHLGELEWDWHTIIDGKKVLAALEQPKVTRAVPVESDQNQRWIPDAFRSN